MDELCAVEITIKDATSNVLFTKTFDIPKSKVEELEKISPEIKPILEFLGAVAEHIHFS